MSEWITGWMTQWMYNWINGPMVNEIYTWKKSKISMAKSRHKIVLKTI